MIRYRSRRAGHKAGGSHAPILVEARPHPALGDQTPKVFAERLFTMGRQQRCAR